MDEFRAGGFTQNPKLSVIISSYNHADFIEKLIESVLKQTFRGFEVLIIDDGSTDNTRDILGKYKQDECVRIEYQENQGIVNTRNKGIEMTRGEYVCFIDSDDMIMPERFEKQVRVLDNRPGTGIVYSDAYFIDKNDNISGRFSRIFKPYMNNIAKNAFLKYCFFPAVTVMFRRSVFESTGPLRGPDLNCEYFKWIEMSIKSGVEYINEPLAYWRIHGKNTSISRSFEEKHLAVIDGLKDLLIRDPALGVLIGESYKKRYSDILFLIAFKFITKKADIQKGIVYLSRSLDEKRTIKNILAMIICRVLPQRAVRTIFKAAAWWAIGRHSKVYAGSISAN